jgi:hypothetical protein
MLIIFSALAYFEKWERLMTILVFIFWMNFLTRTSVINTGGEVLVGLFLFYLIFIGKTKSKDRNIWMLQNALNNTFLFAIVIQFLSVYIISTWWKLQDPGWMSGLAVLHASNIDTYSFANFGGFLDQHLWLAKLITFSSILYQALFPILIWSKKIKPYLLIAGVLFHLGIAIFMGIFSFGLIMILSYAIFLNEKQIEWIAKRLPFIKPKVKAEN